MYSQEQLLGKQLQQFRQMPTETEWLEFKETKDVFNFDELEKYFSALSNEANLKHQQSSWFIFGIRDRHPHTQKGFLNNNG